jgi:hypothetical protein
VKPASRKSWNSFGAVSARHLAGSPVHHRPAAGVDAAACRGAWRAGRHRRDLAAADDHGAAVDHAAGAVDDTTVRDRQILPVRRSRGCACACDQQTAQP